MAISGTTFAETGAVCVGLTGQTLPDEVYFTAVREGLAGRTAALFAGAGAVVVSLTVPTLPLMLYFPVARGGLTGRATVFLLSLRAVRGGLAARTGTVFAGPGAAVDGLATTTLPEALAERTPFGGRNLAAILLDGCDDVVSCLTYLDHQRAFHDKTSFDPGRKPSDEQTAFGESPLASRELSMVSTLAPASWDGHRAEVEICTQMR